MTVNMYKLTSGEDIIGTVISEGSDSIVLDDVVSLVYHPTGQQGQMSVGFAPFMPHSEGTVALRNAAIAVATTPKAEMLSEYNRIFSKIQIASASMLAGM